MGLFDNLFKTTPSELPSYYPASEEEAWMAIIYACISVDDNVTEIELDDFVKACSFKTLFKGYDIVETYKKLLDVRPAYGSFAMIDGSVESVSEDYKPTVFAMAVEILLNDGILSKSEQQVIEHLSVAMGLDSALSERIIDVLLIKSKGSLILY